MRLKLNRTKTNTLAGWIFVSPVLLGILLFTFVPVLLSFYFGFTDYDNIHAPNWVGLDNYIKMFHDDIFLHSLKITWKYAIFSVSISFFLSFIFALLMNSNVKGIAVFRTLLYLPCVVPGLASAMIWKDLFNPTEAGRFNQVLKWITEFLNNVFHFGIEYKPYPFFHHPDTAWNSMIIMGLWGLGGGMLMWIAGFKGVPTALYESAALDGAKWYHRLFHITIPMISPIIFYKIISAVIGSLQAFAGAYLTTGGGPMHSTNFLVLNIYNTGLTTMKMGYACAQSWILFIMILALTAIIFKTGGWVYYGEEQ